MNLSTITAEELKNKYETLAYNKSDFINLLTKLAVKGYDISYDKSMAVFYFTGFNVVASPTCINFVEPFVKKDTN